jgi:hypothetical protein
MDFDLALARNRVSNTMNSLFLRYDCCSLCHNGIKNPLWLSWFDGIGLFIRKYHNMRKWRDDWEFVPTIRKLRLIRLGNFKRPSGASQWAQHPSNPQNMDPANHVIGTPYSEAFLRPMVEFLELLTFLESLSSWANPSPTNIHRSLDPSAPFCGSTQAHSWFAKLTPNSLISQTTFPPTANVLLFTAKAQGFMADQLWFCWLPCLPFFHESLEHFQSCI